MNATDNITQERLKEVFEYREGKFYWKEGHSKKVSGKLAGSINRFGYRKIKIDYIPHHNHRLVWLWHTGNLPKHDLDHINHDRLDDRIENLREATRGDNTRNRSPIKNASRPYIGVQKKNNRWECYITALGKAMFLGSFVDIEEAISMRLTANDHYGFHINHGFAKENL